MTSKIKPTSAWGPPLWISIHNVALGFPDAPTQNERDTYKQFYTLLGNVIPCKKCANNYTEHLKEINIDHFLFNKQDLFQWTVLLHNIVNKSLGKKEWGFKEAWDHYNTFSYHKEAAEASSSSSNNMSIYNEKNILLMILICVIVLLTIWCLIIKK